MDEVHLGEPWAIGAHRPSSPPARAHEIYAGATEILLSPEYPSKKDRCPLGHGINFLPVMSAVGGCDRTVPDALLQPTEEHL